MAPSSGFDCNACRSILVASLQTILRLWLKPDEEPNLASERNCGRAPKAPGDDRGRCGPDNVDASLLLLLTDGVLICVLFSLFDVFDVAFNPASFDPPGGDFALALLRVVAFPLFSALSGCEYALAGLSA